MTKHLHKRPMKFEVTTEMLPAKHLASAENATEPKKSQATKKK